MNWREFEIGFDIVFERGFEIGLLARVELLLARVELLFVLGYFPLFGVSRKATFVLLSSNNASNWYLLYDVLVT